MIMRKIITLMLLTIGLNIHSQTVELELLSAAGDNFKNPNIELCWSIGEVVT
jgi:hypothetical protein